MKKRVSKWGLTAVPRALVGRKRAIWGKPLRVTLLESNQAITYSLSRGYMLFSDSFGKCQVFSYILHSMLLVWSGISMVICIWRGGNLEDERGKFPKQKCCFVFAVYQECGKWEKWCIKKEVNTRGNFPLEFCDFVGFGRLRLYSVGGIGSGGRDSQRPDVHNVRSHPVEFLVDFRRLEQCCGIPDSSPLKNIY